jgi:hypothetical protein
MLLVVPLPLAVLRVLSPAWGGGHGRTGASRSKGELRFVRRFPRWHACVCSMKNV